MDHALPGDKHAQLDCSHKRSLTKIISTSLLCASVYCGSIIVPILPQISYAEAQSLPRTDPNAQLLLSADQLIYDNDNQIVTASGNVQMEYDGYNVVANRVSYNQKTRRVKASGNVEILEPDGNRIYAKEIDITDDFGDGFVNALRVETADNTHIAAESAERFAGQKTVFHHGVYTACEPCKDMPERPPIWQVKAEKVILDGVERTVTYRNARFELFGHPIAFLPYFSHADPTIERKSGFLIPNFGTSRELGYSWRQSYFIATGDSHDLTLSATGFTKQGVLGEAKWRHQLENGFYSITAAGIDQKDSKEFASGTSDSRVSGRAMVGSEGLFNINPRWTFGWDVLAQTDNNFSRTYKVDGFTASNFTNQIYLRGLNDRSYFDLSSKRYLVQNSLLTNSASAFQFESEQPTVLPVFDYNYVKAEDIAGGEFSFDVNLTGIHRNQLGSVWELDALGDPVRAIRTHGIKGETARLSADLAWKKTITTSSGIGITPSISLRGDWTSSNASTADGMPLSDGTYTRFMPTAGLEVSYPILARTAGATHVFEPIAQVFARPDLAFDGVVPNEDSQSLVFDASTLFQRDKFSGYDRIESGTRANVGLIYSAQFDNGLALNGLVGQSFHLAGDNPYARMDDLTNVGEESGLESDRSDFVASLAATTTSGLALNTQARFDEKSLAIRRTDTTLSFSNSQGSVAANYTHIAAQPEYSFDTIRQQIGFITSVNINEHWKVFGGAQYDIASNLMIGDSVGLSYHDECFTFSLSFNESRSSSNNTEDSQSISFKLGLRTIGDYEGSVSDENYQEYTGKDNF